MDKIKKIIIGCCIIIVIIIIALIIFLKNDKSEDILIEESYGEQFEIDEEKENADIVKKFDEVTNPDRYYAVESALNVYLNVIQKMKGIVHHQRYDDETLKNEGTAQLYSILDGQYKNELNVKEADLQSKIKEYTNYDMIINKMYVYDQTISMSTYLVYFNIDGTENKILIKTDLDSGTFSIFLQDYVEEKNYSESMNNKDFAISNLKIDKNSDSSNLLKYISISDEYMVLRYIDSLKYNLLNNIEYTYNNLMQDEYKEKRFGNINDFAKYIDDNKEEFENLELAKYMVSSKDEGKEYICTDKYNNIYVFKEKAVMDYTFELDTYTIAREDVISNYKNASASQKVQMNIDKFFQMINRHDYKTSYNCLDETFRKNNIQSEEKFEIIAKQIFFTHNKVYYSSLEELGNNTYSAKIQLTDLAEENADSRVMTIIMRLEEETDFVMSFSME